MQAVRIQIVFSASGTHFSNPQGLVQLEGLGKLKQFTSSGLNLRLSGLWQRAPYKNIVLFNIL
jgi:hypothetical protein